LISALTKSTNSKSRCQRWCRDIFGEIGGEKRRRIYHRGHGEHGGREISANNSVCSKQL